MIEVETFYDPDAPKGWNGRCIEHPEINATAANGGAGHNWQTPAMNLQEMKEMLVARWNLVMSDNKTLDDFNFTEGAPWRHNDADPDGDVTVIDGSEWS